MKVRKILYMESFNQHQKSVAFAQLIDRGIDVAV
jgi:hypothetical protein|nr:MAG TPA: hypothetical protein [Caudoviricetes sp.]